jgi:hypothetical protein
MHGSIGPHVASGSSRMPLRSPSLGQSPSRARAMPTSSCCLSCPPTFRCRRGTRRSSAVSGVQYALETYRGGFLVTDGHHNRVLRVTLDGEVTELIAFDNIVPTGLAVAGHTVYMAEAGPVPHLPQDGKVVAFRPKSPTATEVASGAAEHRRARQGQRGRHLHRHHGRSGPADLARVHWEHRVCRHPHRGDLDDRRRLGFALRRVALSNRGA